jgi:hypothetical protein
MRYTEPLPSWLTYKHRPVRRRHGRPSPPPLVSVLKYPTSVRSGRNRYVGATGRRQISSQVERRAAIVCSTATSAAPPVFSAANGEPTGEDCHRLRHRPRFIRAPRAARTATRSSGLQVARRSPSDAPPVEGHVGEPEGLRRHVGVERDEFALALDADVAERDIVHPPASPHRNPDVTLGLGMGGTGGHVNARTPRFRDADVAIEDVLAAPD